MPFLLEICIFLALLLILKLVMSKPEKNTEDKKSDQPNRLEILKRKVWFFSLMSILSYTLIYFGLLLYHRISGFDQFLITEPTSLFLPALILGLLFLGVFRIKISKSKGELTKVILRKEIIEIAVAGILALILVFLDFNLYLRMDKDFIYFKKGFEKEEKFPIAEILKIEETKNSHFVIIFKNGKVKTDKFGGDVPAFIEVLRGK